MKERTSGLVTKMINRRYLRRLINEEVRKRKQRALLLAMHQADLNKNLIKNTVYLLLGISAVVSPVILLVSYLKYN